MSPHHVAEIVTIASVAPWIGCSRLGRWVAKIIVLATLGAGALITGSGCTMLQRAVGAPAEQPPLVQVYAFKEVYTAVLAEHNAAVESGFYDKSSDAFRQVNRLLDTVDAALPQAELAARQGKTDWRTWLVQATTAFDQYLKIRGGAVIAPPPTTRPLQTPRPATRAAPPAVQPTDLSTEILWDPKSSFPSSLRASRELRLWSTHTRLRTAANPSPTSTRRPSTPPSRHNKLVAVASRWRTAVRQA